MSPALEIYLVGLVFRSAGYHFSCRHIRGTPGSEPLEMSWPWTLLVHHLFDIYLMYSTQKYLGPELQFPFFVRSWLSCYRIEQGCWLGLGLLEDYLDVHHVLVHHQTPCSGSHTGLGPPSTVTGVPLHL
jgi:hypothetical protein